MVSDSTLCDRYNIVNRVKINAWIPATNKLKPCHASIGTIDPMKPKILKSPIAFVDIPSIKAVKIPPANMLPNKRKPNVNVFVNSSIILRSEEHTSELQSRGHLVCRL